MTGTATHAPTTRRRQARPWNSDPQPLGPIPPSPAQTKALFTQWREHPEDCIQQAILDPYNAATGQQIQMTAHQRAATEAVRDLVAAKCAVQRGTATPEQRELAKKIGVSIMAGKGIGKDTWVSWMLLWFTWLFPYCKNVCTSVSADQLEKVLWSEIAKWHQYSLMKPWVKLQTSKLFYTELSEDVVGKRWFTYTKTANPHSTELEPEGMAGAHEDYMMVVVDEASGVSDAICHSLEGTLTQFGNFMILIFNPTRATGYAIRSQEEDSAHWVTLHWNAEDSEIKNPAVHERLLDRYGRDSNPYRIRVLGLPPITDEQTMFPMDWLMEATQREIEGHEREPLVKGVDCGAGGDKSIIATRRGWQVYPLKRNLTPNAKVLTDWVGTDMDVERPDRVFIDTIGIGWAVEDQLRQLKGAVIEAADARRTADRDDQYFNKRAEMYGRIREALEKGLLALPDDQDLIDQLAATRCDYPGGKLKILDKKKLKKLIGHSPDEADALALTFYREPSLLTRITARRPQPPMPRHEEQGWLRA